MPVFIYRPLSPELQSSRDEGGSIVIGLVNNMPKPGLRSTERQFYELLSAASNGLKVWLRLFSLSEVPRAQVGRLLISQSYENVSHLWTSRLDGLVVTGTEPRAAALVDEPYWQTLVKLIDWAEENTLSTIWSCLAAHAAVYHQDGISRRALRGKLSGVFDSSRVQDHTIMFRAPSSWRVPHSRYNELSEDLLVSNGYSILSRSPKAGVDIFVKQRQSLFIYLQGHPEYDPGALLREYRRDSARFLAGERDDYPDMPCSYLDDETTAVLEAYRKNVLNNRGSDLIPSFPAVAKEKFPYDWRGLATQLYTNWFTYLVEQKARIPSPLPSLVTREAFSGTIQQDGYGYRTL
jgi:homoserine O-succinyltransferase